MKSQNAGADPCFCGRCMPLSSLQVCHVPPDLFLPMGWASLPFIRGMPDVGPGGLVAGPRTGGRVPDRLSAPASTASGLEVGRYLPSGRHPSPTLSPPVSQLPDPAVGPPAILLLLALHADFPLPWRRPFLLCLPPVSPA